MIQWSAQKMRKPLAENLHDPHLISTGSFHAKFEVAEASIKTVVATPVNFDRYNFFLDYLLVLTGMKKIAFTRKSLAVIGHTCHHRTTSIIMLILKFHCNDISTILVLANPKYF
jgi:hypothetical protein